MKSLYLNFLNFYCSSFLISFLSFHIPPPFIVFFSFLDYYMFSFIPRLLPIHPFSHFIFIFTVDVLFWEVCLYLVVVCRAVSFLKYCYRQSFHSFSQNKTMTTKSENIHTLKRIHSKTRSPLFQYIIETKERKYCCLKKACSR